MARRTRKTIDPLAVTSALFDGSRYAAALGPAVCVPLQGTRQEIRSRIRTECPLLPGVYAIADAAGQLIYVGMSRKLRGRLLTYFTSQGRGKKETRLGRKAKTLVFQPVAHELVARLRERELIRLIRPAANVQGHPGQLKLGYLVLGEHEAPGFTLLPRIPRSHVGTWGPVPMTKFMRSAVEELNHLFQLRDCPRETPMLFRGEPQAEVEPAPCLRAELGTCLSPCVGGCTRRAYARAVSTARAFLEGESPETLEQLERDLAEAVAERKYERAARIRDRLQSLSRLNLSLRRFHDWRSKAHFVYPLTSALDGGELWMIVVRGDVRHVVRRPQGSEEKNAVRELLDAARRQLQGRQGESVVTGPDEFAAGRILSRWFRLNESEKIKRLTLARSRSLCRSGAKVADKPCDVARRESKDGSPSSAGD